MLMISSHIIPPLASGTAISMPGFKYITLSHCAWVALLFIKTFIYSFSLRESGDAKMAELLVEIPEELEVGSKELTKEELNTIVSKALKERLSERLMFKVADELLKNSKITDELALKWGSELKREVAKRHGL